MTNKIQTQIATRGTRIQLTDWLFQSAKPKISSVCSIKWRKVPYLKRLFDTQRIHGDERPARNIFRQILPEFYIKQMHNCSQAMHFMRMAMQF